VRLRSVVKSLAVVGSLAGLGVTGLGILGVRAGGDPAFQVISPGEAQAFLISMFMLFAVTLEAGLLASRFPRACSLVLLAAGGLILASSALGAISFFGGGLVLLPEALVVFLAGTIAVSRAPIAPRLREG